MGKAVKVRSNQMGTILRICNDVFVAVWHSGHASSERILYFLGGLFCGETIMQESQRKMLILRMVGIFQNHFQLGFMVDDGENAH